MHQLACVNRRLFFQGAGLSLGAAALTELLNQARGADDRRTTRLPVTPPRAKRVIYLHLIGAPSHLDLFDHKPELVRRNGEPCPESLLKGKRFAFLGSDKRLSGSRFKFDRHGDSGQTFSELLPHLASVADDVAVVRSLHTEEINHAPAQIFLHTGFGRGDRPSFGSWVTYGLGSENADLPAYVVLLSGAAGGAGTATWSSGFLPGVHQGIPFRSQGDAVLFLSNPAGHSAASRRRTLDAIAALNQSRLADAGDPEIATRINQYELAYRMQTSVPDLMNLRGETAETLALYGAEPGKASFANNCLLARRLVERGVRIVELYDADWDHHANLDVALPRKTRDVDQPMAALIRDLKRRGLLEDTLVVWASEFGRTPLAQGIGGEGEKIKPGRDHHKDAFSIWLSGGGIRAGASVGQTDELGFNVVEQPVHVHDLNATLLHLLGLNHERLTFRHQGRDFRLTDVHGRVVSELLG